MRNLSHPPSSPSSCNSLHSSHDHSTSPSMTGPVSYTTSKLAQATLAKSDQGSTPCVSSSTHSATLHGPELPAHLDDHVPSIPPIAVDTPSEYYAWTSSRNGYDITVCCVPPSGHQAPGMPFVKGDFIPSVGDFLGVEKVVNDVAHIIVRRHVTKIIIRSPNRLSRSEVALWFTVPIQFKYPDNTRLVNRAFVWRAGPLSRLLNVVFYPWMSLCTVLFQIFLFIN